MLNEMYSGLNNGVYTDYCHHLGVRSWKAVDPTSFFLTNKTMLI